MSVRAWLCAGLLALAVTLTQGSAEAINLQPGQPAWDFTVPTTAGESVSLHDYRGEVVMVVFWASWGYRCREELDFLKKMQVKYPAVRFLAVNAENDRSPEENVVRARQVADEWKLPFPIGIDEGLKVWDLYKIAALPTSMIVGPDGKLLLVQLSFTLNSPEAIDEALRSASPPPAPDKVALGEGK